MPVKNLINAGIGFNPGSIKYIITRGLSIATAVPSVIASFDVFVGDESMAITTPSETFDVSIGDESFQVKVTK